MAIIKELQDGTPTARAAGSHMVSAPARHVFTAFYDAADIGLEPGDDILIGELPGYSTLEQILVTVENVEAGGVVRLGVSPTADGTADIEEATFTHFSGGAASKDVALDTEGPVANTQLGTQDFTGIVVNTNNFLKNPEPAGLWLRVPAGSPAVQLARVRVDVVMTTFGLTNNQ